MAFCPLLRQRGRAGRSSAPNAAPRLPEQQTLAAARSAGQPRRSRSRSARTASTPAGGLRIPRRGAAEDGEKRSKRRSSSGSLRGVLVLLALRLWRLIGRK